MNRRHFFRTLVAGAGAAAAAKSLPASALNSPRGSRQIHNPLRTGGVDQYIRSNTWDVSPRHERDFAEFLEHALRDDGGPRFVFQLSRPDLGWQRIEVPRRRRW